MKIKSDRTPCVMLAAVVAIVLGMAAYEIFFGSAGDSASLKVRIIFMAVFATVLIVLTLMEVISFGRKLELNAEGCRISLGCFHRFYTWDQIQTRRVEKYFRHGFSMVDLHPYKGCLFLSSRRVKPKRSAAMQMYIHPWSSITIHAQQDPKKVKRMRNYSNIYEVDIPILAGKLQEWGVQVEGLSDGSRIDLLK